MHSLDSGSESGMCLGTGDFSVHLLTQLSILAITDQVYHIAIALQAASCTFFDDAGKTYNVQSKRYTNSKEIIYGPVVLKRVQCSPLTAM